MELGLRNTCLVLLYGKNWKGKKPEKGGVGN